MRKSPTVDRIIKLHVPGTDPPSHPPATESGGGLGGQMKNFRGPSRWRF